MFQFQLRTLFFATLIVGVYAALVPTYGFGRSVVCLVTLMLGGSSLLFFFTAWNALIDEQLRNALAATVLGCLIFLGATSIGSIVFHPPAHHTSVFQP